MYSLFPCILKNGGIIMFMPVLSGIVVSVDAFFIGLSLGLQKKCRFLHLVVINAFLFGLCIIGFLIAGQIYELIGFDADLAVGLSFITLGLWCILHYIVSEHIKRRKKNVDVSARKGEILKKKISERVLDASASEENASGYKASFKTITLVGLVMSTEAMLITMGITFIFIPNSTFLIPITVALAHFIYSALSFHLARIEHVKRIPVVISHVISGFALIIYGLMAIFVEFGI